MLKEAISLPVLAFDFEMSYFKEQGLHLSSLHSEELYQFFRDNLVGGPAITFHRHAEKDQTKIRQSQYGQEARPVQRVVGYNTNAMYLWALSKPMPVDRLPPEPPVEADWNQASPGVWRTSGWPGWVTVSPTFAPASTRGEKRIGSRQLPVDGYDAASQTAYEFHSCYWHGHRCWLTAKQFTRPRRIQTRLGPSSS